MKKIIFFLSLSLNLLFTISVSAEEKDSIKLSSISLSSGDGVLSQGLLFESSFSRGKDLINLYLGERDLAVAYLKAFANEKLFFGPVLEYYLNLPTLGVQVLSMPIKNISTFSWLGFSAGAPGEKVDFSKWQYLFFYQSIDYTFKRFTLSAIIMEYEGWQPIIDLKYRQPIMKNVDFFSSVGYNFFKDGRALFRLGIFYKL